MKIATLIMVRMPKGKHGIKLYGEQMIQRFFVMLKH